MPRLLVTGGAGFIGTHVANTAAQAGWDVQILDLVSQHSQIHSKINFIQGDVRDKNMVEEIVNQCEAVVHLAAQVSVPQSFANPDKTHSINVEGTQVVLEASRKFGVDKVIVASSAAVYGRTSLLPLKEDAAGDCISPYANTKWENEIQVDQFRNLGVNSIALRFFNVYGPGQSADNTYASVIQNS
jgi:UDP-glucose 4-epimerase